MFSAVSGLLFTAASLCAIGDVAAIPSAWKNLPKPPVKYSHGWSGYHGHHGQHFHSKCGHMDICEKCVKKHGEWKVEPKHYGDSCEDGFYCNGEEKCDGQGRCMEGTKVDCTGEVENWHVAADCGVEVCSERHKSCKVAITPGDCDDGDHCTDYDQCDIKTGKCRGIPKLLGSKCDTCDEDGDIVTCNDDDEQMCKNGKCVAKPGPPCDLEDAIDVVCYKCGAQPLNCLVYGDLDAEGKKLDYKLKAIALAIEDTCVLDNEINRDRSCAMQLCTNGILAVPAPYAPPADSRSDSLTAGMDVESRPKQCARVPPPGDVNFDCPCNVDSEDIDNQVDNVGRYKVCLTGEGKKAKAVVLDPEGVGCTRVCDTNTRTEAPACNDDRVSICLDGTICDEDPSCELDNCYAPSY